MDAEDKEDTEDGISIYSKSLSIMFTLGILLLAIGCVLRIWVKLSSRQEIRALNPMNVRVRNIELFLLKERKRNGWKDSSILIILGSIIVLITALFN